MEYKCCVPGYKSNYDSVSKDGNQKSVSTFGFPKDEQIRQQWIKNIPRDLPKITKHTSWYEILRRKGCPYSHYPHKSRWINIPSK